MYMSDDNKPIGWWLKELDRLLESSFERLLAADGLTRRQWQALNAAAGDEPIAVALAPFLDGNPETIAAVTEPLAARGWLAGDELTPAGQAALTGLTAKVRAQRALVTAGVSDDEYAATVDVLRRMAGNVATA
ncbi:MarR family winged helix-turn-helix transcriptional regulator [Kribbella sp. NPDC005582]|uniref:MarR family winged helix-turn-helix transcriptional regulator n=1 Tax=Kribbella sp. NPDC005582 TaxID=3156893 RepID=UPI0033A18BBF